MVKCLGNEKPGILWEKYEELRPSVDLGKVAVFFVRHREHGGRALIYFDKEKADPMGLGRKFWYWVFDREQQVSIHVRLGLGPMPPEIDVFGRKVKQEKLFGTV